MTRAQWQIIWTLWLLAMIVSFAVFEGLALARGGITLSQYVWDLSAAWPPLPFVAGLLAGGLAGHFWWRGATR